MRGAGSEFIPQQRRLNTKMMLSVGDRMLDAGVYSIEADKNKVEGLAAFNFNRTESSLNYYTVDDLKKMYAGDNIHIVDSQNTNLGQIVRELDQGVALWKLCIIFALVFIAAEVLLLRFLK